MYDRGESWDAARSVIAIPNPAAGSDASFPVPASERMMLLAVAFTLTTDGTAGNRTPVVQVGDGSGVTIVDAVSGYALAPSGAARFSFADGLSEWDSAGGAFASGGCPRVPLDSANTITVHIDGIAAADTLTDVRLVVAQLGVIPDPMP